MLLINREYHLSGSNALRRGEKCSIHTHHSHVIKLYRDSIVYMRDESSEDIKKIALVCTSLVILTNQRCKPLSINFDRECAMAGLKSSQQVQRAKIFTFGLRAFASNQGQHKAQLRANKIFDYKCVFYARNSACRV